jgi:hypothetical protein
MGQLHAKHASFKQHRGFAKIFPDFEKGETGGACKGLGLLPASLERAAKE